MIKYSVFQTDWGYFGIASSDKGLIRTVLPVKNKDKCKKILLNGLKNDVKQDNSRQKSLQKKIIAYYQGKKADFSTVKVDFSRFSGFKQSIYKACFDIKYGKIITYKKLASLCGNEKASRAAGNIMAANETPLIVPCHRVIRSDGQMGGFSAEGGIETKQKMLNLEKGR